MYGIYANIWGILMVNVTIYSSTMDPMGYGYIAIQKLPRFRNSDSETPGIQETPGCPDSETPGCPCQGGTDHCLRGIVLGSSAQMVVLKATTGWMGSEQQAMTWQQISARRKIWGWVKSLVPSEPQNSW